MRTLRQSSTISASVPKYIFSEKVSSMETEIANRPPERKKWLIILVIILLAFILYYMVMVMMAPSKKMNALRKEYGFRQNEKIKINDTIYTDSTYLSLFREMSFLKARTAMAETDSIYLALNLTDSVITLEISGVTVARTKLTRLSSSRMLRDRNSYVISSMLAKPLVIERNFASIQKEPLMIKMAPKDTSEYKPDIIPDTADYEPVNYIYGNG